MRLIKLIAPVFMFFVIGCGTESINGEAKTYNDVAITGAMKNVMWKGDLNPRINLDTISNKEGLYGLGPESFLAGEILVKEGVSYVSRVTSDSTMTVEIVNNAMAPFFVRANVNEWQKVELPENVKTIKDLEFFIDTQTKNNKRPFAFKLLGSINQGNIHVQNLPKGTRVFSPEEAHQGQVKYTLTNEEVEIVGFFSTEHQGIFTHHDSYLHMHLITNDELKMGHLDKVEIDRMILFLPIK